MSSPQDAEPAAAAAVDGLVRAVAERHPQADTELIRRAYAFAERAHAGQFRRSGEPYLVHPVRVASYVAELGFDAASVAAALLHDTVEDTTTTVEQVRQEFGDEVARLVDGVTKLAGITFRSWAEKEAENFRKMLVAVSRDVRVLLLKLADRLHNMETLGYLPPDKQREIARETLEIYAPIAHRLGVHHIKRKLEDEALRYLDPQAYESLKGLVRKKLGERERYVERFSAILRERLREAGLAADVHGRAKHFYSIYDKMRRRNLKFEEIYDVIGFRVLVGTVTECYAALGVVHANWTPVPGRFKDYIALPKENLYQSLHTTIIGEWGERVEVQIRTHEMHQVAEMGIAAHWRYREGGHIPLDEVQRFGWLRRLFELRDQVQDPHEFMGTVRDDLFGEEVFVFTPRGDVVKLPRGSTVVDFAYYIHSDIGHHCTGARVNGRMVPLRYRLRNGDTVEVITSGAQTPRRDWLSFVRTSRARSRIRSWLRREQRRRSREIGRQLLERELARHGLRYTLLRDEGRIDEVARALSVRDAETLESVIGFGKISTVQVLSRLLPPEQVHREKREGRIRRLVRRLARTAGPQIRVAGMEDVMVRVARCCEPLPGQQILGFISPGRGVIIHAAECPHLLDADPQRRVEVEWSGDDHSPRPVQLDVVSIDRPGVLSSISHAISSLGVNITRANVRTLPDRTAVHHFEVMVTCARQLNEVMQAIGRVRGVTRVSRHARGAVQRS